MLLCMPKTSWESLYLRVPKSLKISGKGSVFEVIFPLGGKIQVIRKSSGGRAIMIMFCQCSLISQCYIVWIIGLKTLSRASTSAGAFCLTSSAVSGWETGSTQGAEASPHSSDSEDCGSLETLFYFVLTSLHVSV